MRGTLSFHPPANVSLSTAHRRSGVIRSFRALLPGRPWWLRVMTSSSSSRASRGCADGSRFRRRPVRRFDRLAGPLALRVAGHSPYGATGLLLQELEKFLRRREQSPHAPQILFKFRLVLVSKPAHE